MLSTRTIELEPIQLPAPTITKQQQPSSRLSLSRNVDAPVDQCQTPNSESNFVTQPSQRWNESPSTILRLFSTFFTFFVMGANDAAYGPLLPSLEKHYQLSYVIVSLVFLSPFVGYVGAAILNNWIHLKFGQRGVAIVHSLSHLAAYIIIASHPPYVALVFAFILAGLGNGIADAGWNAWIGTMANSSELLGILHACYGAGGVMSPLVSSTMIAKSKLPWYAFYYFMIGLAVVELVTMTASFWKADGATYRASQKESETLQQGTGLAEALTKLPAARVAWVGALFLLCYVGVEVALGGWIVLFMIRVRKGDEFSSGMSATGFWLGITIGRVILGFVSPRVGIKLSTAIYIAAATALELVFWLVPQFYVSAVAVSLQGFFLGPLFPSVVLVASQLLPKRQHVVVIGFAAAFGGCGAAVLPFLTGLLAQAKGVQVLQPMVLSLLITLLAVWMMFPRLDKKKE